METYEDILAIQINGIKLPKETAKNRNIRSMLEIF